AAKEKTVADRSTRNLLPGNQRQSNPAADALLWRKEGAGGAVTRLWYFDRRICNRHARHQSVGVSVRQWLRRLAVRLPCQSGFAIGQNPVLARRYRTERLPGGNCQSTRNIGSALGASGGALRGINDVPDGDDVGTRRRAAGGLFATGPVPGHVNAESGQG